MHPSLSHPLHSIGSLPFSFPRETLTIAQGEELQLSDRQGKIEMPLVFGVQGRGRRHIDSEKEIRRDP
jgi:hypothetical protein